MDERTLVQAIQSRLDALEARRLADVTPLPAWQMQARRTPDAPRPIPMEDAWKPVVLPVDWGGNEVTTWFRREVAIPERSEGKTAVLNIDPGGLDTEALVYLDGVPYQGLNLGRNELLLSSEACAGRYYEVIVETSAGVKDDKYRFSRATLAILRDEVQAYWYSLRCALETALIFPEDSLDRERRLQALHESLDLSKGSGWKTPDAIRAAHALLEKEAYAAGVDTGRGKACLVGHSHLDIAWGWRIKETVRKAARTFTNTLRCMERYPAFYFTQSQPQLYAFIKETYPELYGQIKQRIREGRWDVVAPTWVEPDCTLAGGESLVRQILFGKRFCREEFGVEPETLFLPDSFGNTWAMPQIARKSGLKYFVTGKLYKGDTNIFPHSLFWWEGIDGTRLFSVITRTYGGDVTPALLKEHWEDFHQKEAHDEILYFFGRPDGGGGILKEHLEYAGRMERLRGLPSIRFGKLEDYLHRAHDQADDLPVWKDELYYENHRAVYTVEALQKQNNRKAEVLFHNVEALASLAHLYGDHYPEARLRRGWEKILLNQFHDILPGTSIKEVHEDSARDYEALFKIGSELRSEALSRIAGKVNTEGEGDTILVFNTLPWSRSDLVRAETEVPDESFGIVDESGHPVPFQVLSDQGPGKQVLFLARDVPSMGYAGYRLVKGKAERLPNSLEVSEGLLENPYFRIQLDDHGDIVSIFDKKACREVLSKGGKGNQLQTFHDVPPENAWPWDMDLSYQDSPLDLFRLERIEILETGPLRASVRITRRSEKSVIRQDIVVYAHIPRIDFETQIDWHEEEVLLKAAFPVDVRSKTATYDIQFGNIERPTHWNTRWDRAKFEVWAHKWADLSEGDYGVSLLNDCKYGYDIKDHCMRLTLIRTTRKSPFPQPRVRHTDQGTHFFVYSLYPHRGNWRTARTVQMGYALNVPLMAVVENAHPGALPARYSLVQTGAKHVVVETVKKAEEGDDLVLRLYEAFGQSGQVALTFSEKPIKAVECDLMEREINAMEVCGDRVELFVSPYEIRTLKIRFRRKT